MNTASIAERMKMKINSKDFRVKEGDEVNLKKWPTAIDPVYELKEHYHELLREHVAHLSPNGKPPGSAGVAVVV